MPGVHPAAFGNPASYSSRFPWDDRKGELIHKEVPNGLVSACFKHRLIRSII